MLKATEDQRQLMDKPERRTGRTLRIAKLGSQGIPHTYGRCESFLEKIGSRLVARGHQVIVYCRSSPFRDPPIAYKGMRLIYLLGIETKASGVIRP